jgi:hypothetical protein
MKQHTLLNAIVIALIALLMTACSSTKAPEMIKTFEISNFPKPVKSFLVIGAGTDEEANSQFETLLVTELKKRGVESYGAKLALDKGTELSKESAIALVKKLDVEGVIVTRLLGTRLEIEKTEKRTEVKVKRPQFESLTDFFVYEYTDIHVEQEFDIAATAVLATDLFSVTNQGRVMSMQSTSFDKNDAESIIKETISEIVNQLKRDNVID